MATLWPPSAPVIQPPRALSPRTALTTAIVFCQPLRSSKPTNFSGCSILQLVYWECRSSTGNVVLVLRTGTMQLHWLLAPERVSSLTNCTLVYKSLHRMVLSFLAELCGLVFTHIYRSHVRSAKKELKVPRRKLSTYGSHAFSIGGPTAWNSLSVHIGLAKLSYGQFSIGLKTFLFRFPVNWEYFYRLRDKLRERPNVFFVCYFYLLGTSPKELSALAQKEHELSATWSSGVIASPGTYHAYQLSINNRCYSQL